MQLKDLFVEGSDYTEVSGVEIGLLSEFSEDYLNPPESLKSISFICHPEKDSDGNSGVPERLMDLLISYKMVQVDVMLEIPAQYFKDAFTCKSIFNIARNMNTGVSLLPPGHKLVSNDYTLIEYNTLIQEFTSEIINRPEFSGTVIPITNYVNYMMLELLLKEKVKDVFKVENEYVIENFVKVMNEESSDAFKAIIKKTFLDAYGGEEGFKNIANTIFNAVYDKSKTVFKDNVEDYLKKQAVEKNAS